jgi:hypothetical protein
METKNLCEQSLEEAFQAIQDFKNNVGLEANQSSKQMYVLVNPHIEWCINRIGRHKVLSKPGRKRKAFHFKYKEWW